MWTDQACPYFNEQSQCRMAAEIAQLPVTLLPVALDQCWTCLSGMEPTPSRPTSIVALLAMRAVVQHQPERGEVLRRRLVQQMRDDAPSSLLIPLDAPIVEEMVVENDPATVLHPLNDYACVHRGDVTRMHSCESCQGRTQLKVFSCRHFTRECTIPPSDAADQFDGLAVQVCIGCDARKIPEDAIPTVQLPVNSI